MRLQKLELWVVAGALLLGGATGCGDSARSRANAERNTQRSAEMEGTAPSSSTTPSFMQVYSGQVSVEAGRVWRVPAGISGPGVVRATFTMKQKVPVGLVPKTEAGVIPTSRSS
jgi:hypothetical protein